MCTLKQAFLDYHAEHPEVFDALKKLALDLKKKGHSRYGIAALWEVMRYNLTIQNPDAVAKFPNNHRAYYARALMLLEPRLKGFFQLCELRSGSELKLRDLTWKSA